MMRPTKLTRERFRPAVELRRLGAPLAYIARVLAVDPGTLYRWLAPDRRGPVYRQFREAMADAERVCIVESLRQLKRLGDRGDYRAVERRLLQVGGDAFRLDREPDLTDGSVVIRTTLKLVGSRSWDQRLAGLGDEHDERAVGLRLLNGPRTGNGDAAPADNGSPPNERSNG
jgi:hypothetical protein